MADLESQASDQDRYFMGFALGEARRGAEEEEIPVGAVVVRDGQVIAQAHNRREETQIPTAHAEILALEAAAAHLKSWRLEECVLYATLEPCLMCVGAMLQARVSRLVFGCLDPKGGAVESLYQLCDDPRLNHSLPVTGGVLEQECSAVLSGFFAGLRGKKRRSSEFA
ncbi:MAG: tRNA-specific adenosine deaminase [Deltaproteobacteria bacterium RIFCSPLOWO2_12_FULL_60_19]|nr:MAG: tRNA-specific adenosine deaminase [Deltaproteobacteria bacterium RIFCSPLOWO2_12_FULL_60_19]